MRLTLAITTVVLPYNCYSKKIISEINIGGVTSDDPTEISEKFNNFFTNVGPDLAKNIPPSRKKPADFLKTVFVIPYFLVPRKFVTLYQA